MTFKYYEWKIILFFNYLGSISVPLDFKKLLMENSVPVIMNDFFISDSFSLLSVCRRRNFAAIINSKPALETIIILISYYYCFNCLGSTRTRVYEQRPYPVYQNANIPYQMKHFSSPPTSHKLQSPQQQPTSQFFYPGSSNGTPVYNNIRPLVKTPGPYVTQVTIRDNHHHHHHHHYANNSLGTKV